MSGYIYALAFVDGIVKIGATKWPESRLRCFPGGKLLLLAECDEYGAVERALHRHFHARLARGKEWFHLSALEVQEIANLSLFHPATESFVSDAVSCCCHPPRFTQDVRRLPSQRGYWCLRFCNPVTLAIKELSYA